MLPAIKPLQEIVDVGIEPDQTLGKLPIRQGGDIFANHRPTEGNYNILIGNLVAAKQHFGKVKAYVCDAIVLDLIACETDKAPGNADQLITIKADELVTMLRDPIL